MSSSGLEWTESSDFFDLPEDLIVLILDLLDLRVQTLLSIASGRYMFGMVWDKLIALRAGPPPRNLGTNSFVERIALLWVLSGWIKKSPKRIVEVDWFLHYLDGSSDLINVLKERASGLRKFSIWGLQESVGMRASIHSVFCSLDWNIIEEISVDYGEEGFIVFDLPAKCPRLKRLSFFARTPETMQKALFALTNNTGSLEHLRVWSQVELLMGQDGRFSSFRPVIEANRNSIKIIDFRAIDPPNYHFRPFFTAIRQSMHKDPAQLLEVHESMFSLPLGSIQLNGSHLLALEMFGIEHLSVDASGPLLDRLLKALLRFQSLSDFICSMLFSGEIKYIRHQTPSIAAWIVRTVAESCDVAPLSTAAAAAVILMASLHGVNFLKTNAELIRKFATMECLAYAAEHAPNIFAQLGVSLRHLFADPLWNQIVISRRKDRRFVFSLAAALSKVKSFALFVYVMTHPLFDASRALRAKFDYRKALIKGWNNMQLAELPDLAQILKLYDSMGWKLASLIYVSGMKLTIGLKPLAAKSLARICTAEMLLEHKGFLAACLASYDDHIPKLVSILKLIWETPPETPLSQEHQKLLCRGLWNGVASANFGEIQMRETCRRLLQEFREATPNELVTWALSDSPDAGPFGLGKESNERKKVKSLLAKLIRDIGVGNSLK